MRAPHAVHKPARRHAGFFVRAPGLLALCLPALAAAQVTSADDYLARMDADGDGRVSLAEYQDWMSYAFDAMDENGDGVLTPDELPGGRGQPVTRDEHRARLARMFAKLDADGDGYLDAQDLAAPPR
jgi:Ca2+-binding EF-hand superfamily protein